MPIQKVVSFLRFDLRRSLKFIPNYFFLVIRIFLSDKLLNRQQKYKILLSQVIGFYQRVRNSDLAHLQVANNSVVFSLIAVGIKNFSFKKFL